MVPKRVSIMVLACLGAVVSLTAHAQPPTLRQSIHATIAVSTQVHYSSDTIPDTWDVISLADAD